MPNHLISEKSPYLLQHAHNPVDWYPWSPEAFHQAKTEDKPIFLSIGYSTCHWCHVMERESFENEQIAQVLNQNFIPIKVDREERPDVDRIYMAFVQATTGSGGWPMSVFLTPDLKPFFGGTYFAPDNRYGRPGFLHILQALAQAWRNDRPRIDQSSAEVVEQLIRNAATPPSRAGMLDTGILDSAYLYFRRTFDSTYGGFGGAPKFPRPVVLNFLLRYYARTRNGEALDMSLKTLRAMAEGGMNDQLGGGFHRYSVDEKWFLPHFEKMLYDQAQLAISYIEAHQISRDPSFAQVARNTLDYVLRDMTGSEGEFYSAEDADSVIDPAQPHEKGEGAFYVWTQAEIDTLLGSPDSAIFNFRYGVEAGGNVHNDPHGEFPGKNVLYIRHSLEESAKQFSLPSDQIRAILDRSIRKLLDHRSVRIRPHLDDKILTAWNGLMISAFARAACALGDERYLAAAQTAAGFILDRMYQPDSHILLRRYRNGDAAIPGFLEDYAFFVQALLDLYEADFDVAHLEAAVELTHKMIELFQDTRDGAFFTTAEGDANLVMRVKDDYDGAEPSGNSIALLNLLRLEQITGRPEYRQAIENAFRGLGSRISQQSVAVPQLLVALDYLHSPQRQVVLAGDPADPVTQAFLRTLRSRFLPHTVTLLADSESTRVRLSHFSPAIGEMQPVDGKPAAYVCENFVCRLPATDGKVLEDLLQ